MLDLLEIESILLNLTQFFFAAEVLTVLLLAMVRRGFLVVNVFSANFQYETEKERGEKQNIQKFLTARCP